MDKLFRPFYNNFMVKSEQKDKYKQIARFITCGDTSGGWEVETIIPAHGDIVRGKELCRKVLERHFNVECNDCSGPYSDQLETHYTSDATLAWLKKMALSYKLQKGEELLEVLIREGSESLGSMQGNSLLTLAKICAESPLPVASHDFLRDPNGVAIYNYGNHAFLNAFGYEWDEFVELPSSRCVDTEEDVEARQKLLDAVKEDIHSNAYDTATAIRVRKDKRKILLKNVNLYNVYDLDDTDDMDLKRIAVEKGDLKPIGQAVWIKEWEYLSEI
jgi:hypothetical protein